ncbi:hypothetical protein UFOVP1158_16 [uncultured Caudovirales phage]|uniref:Uncharacterized protein n=1 Tax=uncultured Caudovirales phage TaxID=2100421 RepID=A0A6J5QRT1_9CAUD|nr:hypothetical protein UFOVP1158_16 [uncultured Caudovirales phage]
MATTENAIDEARAAVWAMMTEDTGTHMLDSGGGSGRAWQRNQAKGYAAAVAERTAWIDGYPASEWTSPSGGIPQRYPAHYSITLSAFHYLAERLQPVAAEDLAAILLRTVEDTYPDEPWLGIMAYYRDELTEAGAEVTEIYNTYNWETLLGQVWQGFTFSAFGDAPPIACISMHNGADVRGGYARPYLFHLHDYGCSTEYAENCLLSEATNAEVHCTNLACGEHGADGAGWGFSIYGPDRIGYDGSPCDDAAEWDTLTCPQCGTVDSIRADSAEPCG